MADDTESDTEANTATFAIFVLWLLVIVAVIGLYVYVGLANE